MGLMNKIGAVADGGKLEIEISKEEAKINDAVKDIGKKVIELMDAGKTYGDDADIKAIYENIKVTRAKIEDLRKKQTDCKSRL